MAKTSAVWGIDIGQCAVKALRCVPGDEPDKISAVAFDFIEYPKILSQPEADPVELVREALEQFLSRNTLQGDRVAISVPGQSGLARFIKLPPVEAKKIPDIVKYEARQQIPFALEDVVWDFQRMAGGSEAEGFVLETEVGLFAMKREQVSRLLKPFYDAGIEVDYVQLTPLALYNYIAFDQMQDLPPADLYDPENPPDSVVVLAMGTDASDLVITNGYRVWQRSLPLGGNHFTKALTKELKLTFARAEHLKRNASHADDAKAVFQAMRPVFSDLVTEVQRSIGYFTNIDKRAKIGRIVSLGNAMKLPGLQRFLAQNLGMDVERAEAFRGLTGADVIDAPTFKDNALSFGVCYGLCLQGLRPVQIGTNLIPPEIVKERLIREKKPWAVGAAALLLLGLTTGFVGDWRAWSSAHKEYRFKSAIAAAERSASSAQQAQTEFQTVKTEFNKTKDVEKNLVHNVEGRELWIEVLKAINLCLRDPNAPPPAVGGNAADELQTTQLECQKVDQLGDWFKGVQRWYRPAETAAAPAADGAQPQTGAASPAAQGPTGEGWVFTLKGYHFHNGDPADEGAEYVLRTLIKNFQQPTLPDPVHDNKPFDVGRLGIGFPVLVDPGEITEVAVASEEVAGADANPGADGAKPGAFGGGGKPAEKPAKMRKVFYFEIQFAWVETPKSKRPENPPATNPAAEQPIAAADNKENGG